MLEVSLRKAGFSVTPAVSVGDALEKLEINPPDLIISETKFATDLDGFELRRRLRGTPEWAEIPFIFLTAETAIENKIKGLELGVDDYLTKPIYIKEIVTRINILLQKKQRQFLDLRKDGTRFAGRVADMPVVDVIQTIEISRKSGVINFTAGPNRQAAIYFRDGKVIDAEAGTLQAEDAVYRLLTWSDGDFEVEFRTVRRREVIEASSQGLLMEGMRRLDEWSRLLEQLPPLSHRFEIDAAELSTRLGEVPDDNNRILRLFDGRRSLLEVIDASDFGDLECLQAISRLYFEGLLLDLDPDVRTKRDTGRAHAVIAPADETPMQGTSSRIPDDRIAPPPQDSTAPASSGGALDLTVSGSIPIQPSDVVASEPLASPTELAADLAPRARRESAQQIDDTDVVGEEEVHGPLSGGYRQSSLRLIDEAVAAAQLIEPSLFADDELSALGIKRATPEQLAAAAASTPTSAPPSAASPTVSASAPVAPSNGTNGASPQNGRGRNKTLPPPLPRAPKLRELEEAPMLDSSLLMSGEHKLPSESDLLDAPMLDSALLTSGEIKIPSEQALAEAPEPAAPASSEPAPVPPAPAETKPAESDDSGVPTVIDAENPGTQARDLTEEDTDVLSRRKFVEATRVDEETLNVHMIGSQGRDRAEAHGELKPPADKSATAQSHRELVTIMPRRKIVEVAETNQEEVSTSDEKGKVTAAAKAAVEAAEAAKAEAVAAKAADKEAEAAALAKAEAEAKRKPESDNKTEGKAEAKTESKADTKGERAAARPVEPPKRRPTAGHGVAVPERGLGRGVQAAIILGSLALAGLVVSKCSKKETAAPVATVQQDAAPAITTTETSDAPSYSGFGLDASDNAVATPVVKVDAAVALKPDAAAVVAVIPDAAVVAPRPDAGTAVATSNVDGGVADKGKEAAALSAKARDALAEGEAQKALDLFDQALALKKDKRTYVDRGRALHNLGRVDEAVASIDEAIKMSESYAPAWEQKGLILWSAQRYGDARPALEMFLQLQPDGPKADKVRTMLDEPR